MSIPDLATYLGISEKSIRMWRSRGLGPTAVKIGRHVRFRPADVEKWVLSEARNATATKTTTAKAS
jgi:excisionase family DNA binding protein